MQSTIDHATALLLLLMLHIKLPDHLEDPFPEPAAIEMAHVTSILECNPTHARNEVKIRLLRTVSRRVELPIVGESGDGNL